MPYFTRVVLSAVVILTATGLSEAALGQSATAFVYQGRLDFNGAPANGAYDFTFKPFLSAAGGSQTGPTFTVHDIPVANGVFTTSIDWGVFDPSLYRFVEISARAPGQPAFQVLSPRQEITPVPLAMSVGTLIFTPGTSTIDQHQDAAPQSASQGAGAQQIK